MLIYDPGIRAVAAVWKYNLISATKIYMAGNDSLSPKSNTIISVETIKRKNKW